MRAVAQRRSPIMSLPTERTNWAACCRSVAHGQPSPSPSIIVPVTLDADLAFYVSARWHSHSIDTSVEFASAKMRASPDVRVIARRWLGADHRESGKLAPWRTSLNANVIDSVARQSSDITA